MSKNTIPANDPVRYMHLRMKNHEGKNDLKGGRTIAYLIDGEAVSYYVARTHFNDNYNARIGRLISRGRLLSARTQEKVIHLTVPTGADARKAIMDDFTTRAFKAVAEASLAGI